MAVYVIYEACTPSGGRGAEVHRSGTRKLAEQWVKTTAKQRRANQQYARFTIRKITL